MFSVQSVLPLLGTQTGRLYLYSVQSVVFYIVKAKVTWTIASNSGIILTDNQFQILFDTLHKKKII